MAWDSSAEQQEIWDRIAAGWSPDEAVETEATAPMIDFLAQLAGDGPALELAVGTGRIAVPLARRGVRVAGIDVSQAMVDALHAAMPADELPVTVGSMATADAPGSGYQLVYLVTQRLFSHHYRLENGKVVEAGGTPHRYVWPSELDVMAKLAGFDAVERYAGWDRAEFTGDSYTSVSVWRKPTR